MGNQVLAPFHHPFGWVVPFDFWSGPFRLLRCLGEKGKMPRNRLPKVESERLRARAINCHRLAAGADHPEFALKLSALAKEYEAKALRAEVVAAQPKE